MINDKNIKDLSIVVKMKDDNFYFVLTDDKQERAVLDLLREMEKGRGIRILNRPIKELIMEEVLSTECSMY